MADLRGYTLLLSGKTTMVTETCYSCGVLFAMTEDYRDHKLRDRTRFHCPNGHGQSYIGKTAETKLKESEARELALKDQLSAAIREGEATRAALLRDRARFAAGACPCCNRSFDNVRRHMAAQHPDYDVTRIKQKVPKVFGCSCGSRFTTFRGLRVHQGHSRKTSGRWQWDLPDQDRWYSHLTVVPS